MVKVSVIMPCFNHSAYLKESIGSVLSQTYSDWELVFVDDGSGDDSFRRAEELTSGQSDVQLIQQENQGQSRARQVGLEAATGDYVVVLDSDDCLEPNMMALCVERYESDSDVDVVVGDALITGEDINCQEGVLEQRLLPGWPGVVRQNYFGMSSAVMFRRIHALEVGGLDAGVKNGAEDWDFWVRLTRFGCRFVVLNQPIARYRLVDSSHSLEFARSLEGIIQLLEFACKKDSRLPDKQGKSISERTYAKFRNGQVMRAFFCDWMLGKNESHLAAILKKLDGRYLNIGYCQDMMVGGAHRFRHGDYTNISLVPEQTRDELIAKSFAEKGISHQTKSIVRLIRRIHGEGLRHYSLSGRFANRWLKLRQYLG